MLGSDVFRVSHRYYPFLPSLAPIAQELVHRGEKLLDPMTLLDYAGIASIPAGETIVIEVALTGATPAQRVAPKDAR